MLQTAYKKGLHETIETQLPKSSKMEAHLYGSVNYKQFAEVLRDPVVGRTLALEVKGKDFARILIPPRPLFTEEELKLQEKDQGKVGISDSGK